MQLGEVGLDPMYGDFKMFLVISENTVDSCSLNFEFQSSFECSLWEGIFKSKGAEYVFL